MVQFKCATGIRPVTLSESTRALCAKALDGYFGRRILKTMGVEITDISNWDELSYRRQIDIVLDRVINQCPIYINDDELLIGSASMGCAILPSIPALKNGEHFMCWGANHITPGFDKAVALGLDAYRLRVESRLKDAALTDKQKEMLNDLIFTLDCLDIWHARYMAELDKMTADAVKADNKPEIARLNAIKENFADVPNKPAKTFYQALQSLWFMFAYARIMANWPGLGRMDKYLWHYLEADLQAGRTTLELAKEQLAHFFIKGCEWITLNEPIYYSGDAQHYQNIVLGGIDEAGKDCCNPVTKMILEIVAELPISDFPIAVRINEQTPQDIMELISQNISFGGGVVAVYNDRLVVNSLVNHGYPYRDAVDFANDGCWEVIPPGKTYFSYIPFDGYIILHKTMGLDKPEQPVFDSYEQLYAEYIGNLKAQIDAIAEPIGKLDNFYMYPVPFIDLLEEGCIEIARSYFELGPTYNVQSPHFGGFADAVNALYAIRELVFNRKRFTYSQYMQMLVSNWEGFEQERREALDSLVYYGNDNDDVDALAVLLCNDYATATDRTLANGVKFICGISTFGRQIEWRDKRFAHPHGYHRGDILANNSSPTPGTDKTGATAAIKSCCKPDMTRMGTGAALDIRLSPTVFDDCSPAEVVVPLIKGFVRLGGYFMQVDTTSVQMLKDAQLHPDEYRSLTVRVSGWSARFITINKEWQDAVILRTEQGL